MNVQLALVINVIRYMPDDDAEEYLRAVLESLPPRRLAKAIEIAQGVQGARGVIAHKAGG